MIRQLECEDLEKVFVLGNKLREKTSYRCIVPDWERALGAIIKMAGEARSLALVAEHDKQITGVMLCTTTSLWWVDQQKGAQVASDVMFYSKYPGDGRKMLERMKKWAFSLPRVIRIEMALSSESRLERVKPFYEAAGFKLEGSLFVLNHPRYEELLRGQEDVCRAS